MVNIGVICPSEIATRRFMPALHKNKNFNFMGVATYTEEERFGIQNTDDTKKTETLINSRKKAIAFAKLFEGELYNSYEEICTAKSIQALYIPLPPALHYKWAKKALHCGTHVILEKPFTLSLQETQELIDIARKNDLAIHENYAFVYHKQLEVIQDIITSGELGEIRLYSMKFGFPQRKATDFRYNSKLGGGALIDAGGYTIKYASLLLGETAKIKSAQLNYIDKFDVDMYGSATLVNDNGVTAQIAFGMDNSYKCELEVWGSNGRLISERVFTAPDGFVPTVTIQKDNIDEKRILPVDDSFYNSMHVFFECLTKNEKRIKNYHSILNQAKLVDDFKKIALT